MTYIFLLLFSFLFTPSGFAGAFLEIEVPVEIQQESLEGKILLAGSFKAVRKPLKEQLLLVSDRVLYLWDGRKKPVPVHSFFGQKPSEEYDYFYEPFPVGTSRLLIGVGKYPSAQMKRDRSKARGGFVRGPKRSGFLILDFKRKKLEHYASLLFKSRPPIPKQLQDVYKPLPENKEIIPEATAAFYDGSRLFVGGYGDLGWIDLDKGAFHAIEFDWEMTFTRTDIEGGGKEHLWVGFDEGGMSGGGVRKIDKSGKRVLVAGVGNYPNDILMWNNRIFVGSDQGLGEIDEGKSQVRKYASKVTPDPLQASVSRLQDRGDKIVGRLGKGWFEMDPIEKKARVYELKYAKRSSVAKAIRDIKVREVIEFKGKTFLATSIGMVSVR